MSKKITRRDFLRAAALSGAGAALAACAPPTPEKIIVKETVQVEKQVEKIVEKPVEKIVEKPVEKIVEKIITPTPRPAPSKIAFLNFLSQETDPKEIEVYRKMIPEFEMQNPDVRIQMQFTQPDQIIERMVAILVSGVTAIDVLQPNPPMAFLLAAQGYLAPIDDIVKELGGEDFFYSTYKWQGKVYAVPFGGGASTIWYRKDLFDQEGIKIPTTYEELEAAAKHFTKKSNPKSPTEYGIALPLSKTQSCQMWAFPFFWNFGSEVFDKDLNVVFDSPATEEALDYYAKLAQYTPEAAVNWTWGDQINSLLSGQSAISFYLGRMLGRTYQNAPQLVGKVQTFMYPKRKLQVCHDDPNIYVINAKSPNIDACKRWLKYTLSTQLQYDFLCSIPSHLPPATKNQQKWWDQAKTGCKELDENPEVKKVVGMAQSIAYNPTLNSGGIVEAVKQGKNTFVATGAANPFMPVLEGTDFFVPTAIQNVVLKKMSPKDSLKDVAPRIEKAVAQAMKDVNWKK